MSVQSEIDRINDNVASTYNVLEGAGAEMPQARNSDNLPNTAASIKAVLYTEQELTSEQKAQVKTNLDIVDCLTVTVDNRWNTSLSAAEIVAAKEKGTIVILNCGILLSEVTASVNGGVVEYADFTTILSGSDQLRKLTVRIVGNKATPTFTEINTGGGGSGGETVQADWNQMDETAADFIKNKPFGDKAVVFFDDNALAFEGGFGSAEMVSFATIGSQVTVVLDNITYIWSVVAIGQDSGFGNLALLGEGEDTGEPLCGIFAADFGGLMLVHADADAGSHSITITGTNTEKLSANYYDATAILYDNGEGYLCNDIFGNNNATKNDVAFFVGKFPILVAYGNLYCLVLNVDLDYMKDYAAVTVYRNGNYETLYTAEYTPPTT